MIDQLIKDELFTRQEKKQIWKNNFGNSLFGIDVFGRKIFKDNFVCHLILPEIHGGEVIIENAIPVHILSAKEKDNLIIGKVNGFQYEVWKNNNNGVGRLIVDGIYKK